MIYEQIAPYLCGEQAIYDKKGMCDGKYMHEVPEKYNHFEIITMHAEENDGEAFFKIYLDFDSGKIELNKYAIFGRFQGTKYNQPYWEYCVEIEAENEHQATELLKLRNSEAEFLVKINRIVQK